MATTAKKDARQSRAYPKGRVGFMVVMVCKGGTLFELNCCRRLATAESQLKGLPRFRFFKKFVRRAVIVRVHRVYKNHDKVLLPLDEVAKAVRRSGVGLVRRRNGRALPKPCHKADGKPYLWAWGRMRNYLQNEYGSRL